jgi:hypothetical protein
MKTCTKCKETRQFEEFTKDKNSPDGYFSHCKPCRSKYRKKHYAANKDRLLAQNVEWREANRERHLAYHRQYDAERRVRTQEYREQSRLRNAERRMFGGRDPEKPWPTMEIGYKSAHIRIYETFGAASLRSCLGCGEQAAEWSYRGDSPYELVGEHTNESGTRLVAYSPDPRDYDPRCKTCHVKYDRNRAEETAAA